MSNLQLQVQLFQEPNQGLDRSALISPHLPSASTTSPIRQKKSKSHFSIASLSPFVHFSVSSPDRSQQNPDQVRRLFQSQSVSTSRLPPFVISLSLSLSLSRFPSASLCVAELFHRKRPDKETENMILNFRRNEVKLASMVGSIT
jgi:hypothetical protein